MNKTMASQRRFGVACVPPLLAVLGVCVGIGLGALASGAEFRSGGVAADTGRVTDVVTLPRVIVTPRGADGAEPASPYSELCSRFHC